MKVGTYSWASGSPSWAAQRQQHLRPPGPADRVAVQLAAAETARPREADLWYVDEDVCAATERLPCHVPIVAAEPSADPVMTGGARKPSSACSRPSPARIERRR
jgi:hypothetical protein